MRVLVGSTGAADQERVLSSNDALSSRDRWARLRFSIVGSLLAAPPKGGELRARLKELATKTYRHPLTGEAIRFGYSSLERWFYLARKSDDPVAALRERPRSHAGRLRSLSQTAIQILTAQHREHPNWSVQLHADNLRAALAEHEPGKPAPSYPSVRRYLKSQGLFRRPRPKRHTKGALAAVERLENWEVRSYEAEHVHALWHADFHDGSRKVLLPDGQWITPVLFGAIDDRSRLVCHLQWYTNERTETLVHGISQALQRRGRPRALMTDNGSAMMSGEFTEGLLKLGITHRPTLCYSPFQNGKQESFWGQAEGRLLAMLEGVGELSLELLNRATHAWVELDYHRALHEEIGTTPLKRYLAGPSVGRECPSSEALRAAFRIQVKRRQRRSDGTVPLEGQRFEIPSRYRHLETLHLRYARWDLRRVDLVDPRTDTILCPVFPLDKAANADAQRRRLQPLRSDPQPPPSSGMAPLLRKLLADYAATGLPPPYLPTDTEDHEDCA